jgi:hypothetical protein
VLAGAAVMLAVTALVALAGQSTEQRSSLIAISPKSPINALALDFLRNGAQMTVADIGKQMSALAKNPGAQLSFPARTMMLAAGPESQANQQLAGSQETRARSSCTLHSPAAPPLLPALQEEHPAADCVGVRRRVSALREEGHHPREVRRAVEEARRRGALDEHHNGQGFQGVERGHVGKFPHSHPPAAACYP